MSLTCNTLEAGRRRERDGHVAVEDVSQAKVIKDVQHAQPLIEALAGRRPVEPADAWNIAWATGKQCAANSDPERLARRAMPGAEPTAVAKRE